MFPLLHQFLVENKVINLPGIGNLHLTNFAAQPDSEYQHLLPPIQKFSLQKEYSNSNDQQLMGFLSKNLQLPEEQVYTAFQQFINASKNTLATHHLLYWPNLGVFQQDEKNNIHFTHTSDIENYYQPVNTNRIVRTGAEHPVLVGNNETTNLAIQAEQEEAAAMAIKKDYWWAWGIAIAVVSFVLIALRYFDVL